MAENKYLSVILLVLLVLSMIPVLINFKSQAENQYACDSNPLFTRLNVTLCMNTTGGNSVAADYYGTTTTENALLAVMILLIVIGIVMTSVGLIRKH